MKKSVLVTGAANGTGYAIARRFAREGYDVFLTSRNGEKARAAAQRLAAECGVFAAGYALPVGEEALVCDVFADIRARGYLLSALVLNAANLGIHQDALTVPLEEFQAVIDTNMVWNFSIARQAALQMRQAGGGSIVFITSNTAYRAIPDRVAYGASKSGILGMMRALALDWGKYGIHVNSVLPGMIKTERWRQNQGDIQHVPSAYTPLGDVAEFDDIAGAAYFLAGPDNRNITGAELTVDGGNMVQLYPILPET